MGKPTNTAVEEQHLEWLMGGDPAAIEAQEAEGQKQLAGTGTLPTRVFGKTTREDVEALGFIFGEPYEDDPMFTPVEFPPGWELVATEHSMWLHLEFNGVNKGVVYYKAAFYDRSATLELL